MPPDQRGGYVPLGCSSRLSRILGSMALVAVVLGAAPAHAQITDEPISPYPDPRLFARGWFAEAEIGAVIPLGKARAAMETGPMFGVRAGWEFARWVALQVRGAGSTHAMQIEGQPEIDQLMQ